MVDNGTLSDGSYGGEVTDVDLPEEVIAEIFRRHLLALGAITAAGAAVVGELAELPGPAPVPLPSQLSYVHVGQVRDLTQRLSEARQHLRRRPGGAQCGRRVGPATAGCAGH